MNILIVDDEASALRDIERKIKKAAPDVVTVTANEADKAVGLFAQQDFDAVFLDINMPVKDGLTLAKEMKALHRDTNIIILTGYPQYALDAYKLYVSDYIVKPAHTADIKRALENLRYPVNDTHKGLYVRCFGNFEVFFDGEPIHFGRSKVKELLAYLIDRRGSTVTNAEIRAVLWQDETRDEDRQRKYLAQIAYDLRAKLDGLGAADIFVQSRDSYAIVPEKIPCDYYTALKRGTLAEHGEYMSQYSWARLCM